MIGYQQSRSLDLDPSTESWQTGSTVGSDASPPLVNATVEYAEVIRDFSATATANSQGLTVAQLFARTTVHEVAHQFGLVRKEDGGDGSGHRTEASVMLLNPYVIPNNQFLFYPNDIRRLRLTLESP